MEALISQYSAMSQLVRDTMSDTKQDAGFANKYHKRSPSF